MENVTRNSLSCNFIWSSENRNEQEFGEIIDRNSLRVFVGNIILIEGHFMMSGHESFTSQSSPYLSVSVRLPITGRSLMRGSLYMCRLVVDLA